MDTFLQRHADHIHGVLSGFDRIRFRGTLRAVCHARGFFAFLCALKVLLKTFKTFVDGTASRLKHATEQLAKATPVGRVVYLAGARDKQGVIDDLIREHAIPDEFTGLLAVLSAVEPCHSFELHKKAASQRLELRPACRKCLHYYLYVRDPRLGLLHLRVMTWFPRTVQICLNGREWLARQLDAAGVAYDRLDNTFARVADVGKAQELLDGQRATDWPALLSGLVETYHPTFARLLRELTLRDYYWTSEQTEWATDVVFRSAEALRPLYRRLIRHATENLSSPDVMRFLQQRLTKAGGVHGQCEQEIVTDRTTRLEGTRVKHRLGRNSVKMSDKFGRVLRVETTIHAAEGLKVWRRTENDPAGPARRRPLRRGVADLHRRCELSQKANETYLEAMAAAASPRTLQSLADPVSAGVTRKGRRHRGLRVMSPEDGPLLRAINRGEYAIAGFRNRDVRAHLFGEAPADPAARKTQRGRVTRGLMLLRAHGLIQKVPKSHRYKITALGRELATAVSYAAETDLNTFSQAA